MQRKHFGMNHGETRAYLVEDGDHVVSDHGARLIQVAPGPAAPVAREPADTVSPVSPVLSPSRSVSPFSPDSEPKPKRLRRLERIVTVIDETDLETQLDNID